MSWLIDLRVWLENNPAMCLTAVAALTALAALFEARSRHKRRLGLRELAARWHMTYSPHDRLRLAHRIAPQLPTPGAADVYVTDVIYGAQSDAYHHIFTVEYTTGVVTAKHRQIRVARLSELRNREPSPVTLAPTDLPLPEQYRRLEPTKQSPASEE